MKLPTLFRRSANPNRIDALALGLISIVFLIVSYANIARWSIWFDEAFSAYLMRYNMFDIARYTSTDVHPPLYYWLLKIWTSIFGTGDVALRSLSAVAILAAIIVTYHLIRKLFGRRAAIWTGGLLAISPMVIRYSEEARMYSVVLLIVAAATHMLVCATEHPTRKKWLIYGALVSLGMWTHYFTAIVWLSHWVWRWIVRGAFTSTKKYFTRDWIYAHLLAVGLFIPWLPFMAKQLGTVQGTGFWIKSVTADSLTNFLTNTFLFMEHSDVRNWAAVLFTVSCLISIASIAYGYRRLSSLQKPLYALVIVMGIAPVIFLVLLSMPPLRPAFIERYLIPSAFWLTVAIAVGLSVVTARMPRRGYLMTTTIALTFAFGVINVYTYGNFNRNATPLEAQSVKQVLEMVTSYDAGNTPVIADSPWRFYEAIHYDTATHPVYFVAADDVTYGSYDMLRDSDYRKIKDLKSFAYTHPTIWYLSNWYNNEPRRPEGAWRLEQVLVGPTPVDGASSARAYKYVYIGN